MKKLSILILAVFCLSPFLAAKVKVITSYNYIADLTQRVGGDLVTVTPLAPGNRDPHYITPRPSFIAKLRKADLLIINGGQLEVGWLPPVMRQANNPGIEINSNGFLSLMDLVAPLEVQKDVSRSQGDVHPDGNPHFQLDPHNIPILAKGITDRLSILDPDNRQAYLKNYTAFTEKWSQKTEQWDKAMENLKGVKVIEYHKLYDHFFSRYHIQLAGTLEPLPGIPPTTRHVAGVIDTVKENGIKLILQDVYHSSKTAKYVAAQTGARMAILPHDVGAVDEATDIFSLFDVFIKRLTTP
jgi:zinc/manganese transport system substrate-binding protein